MKLKHRS